MFAHADHSAGRYRTRHGNDNVLLLLAGQRHTSPLSTAQIRLNYGAMHLGVIAAEQQPRGRNNQGEQPRVDFGETQRVTI